MDHVIVLDFSPCIDDRSPNLSYSHFWAVYVAACRVHCTYQILSVVLFDIVPDILVQFSLTVGVVKLCTDLDRIPQVVYNLSVDMVPSSRH